MSNIEEDKKFDLEIRSLMENAEEPVPEQLWASISERLDAAEAGAAKRPVIPIWLRRTAIGLAAAAAVALGVFLFVPRHSASEEDLVAQTLTPTDKDMTRESENGQVLFDGTMAESGETSSSSEAFENGSDNAAAVAGQTGRKSDSTSHETARDLAQEQESAETIQEQESVETIQEQIERAGGYTAQVIEIESEETESGVSEAAGQGAVTSGTQAEGAGEDASRTAGQVEDMASVDNESEAADGNAGNEYAGSGNGNAGSEYAGIGTGNAGSGYAGTWSDPFSEETSRSVRKVRTAIVMSGDAMTNANTPGVVTAASPGMTSTIIKQNKEGLTESTESSYSIPASFGLGVKIIFTPRWSLGVGVNYSILSRTFSGVYTSYSTETESYTSTNYSKIRNNLSYIGIPINAYFSIISSHAVDFYAYAGGTVEKAVSNRFVLENDGLYKGDMKGVQFSADIGLGVEFIIVDMVGLYIDPCLRYYFDCNQPKSIRTQEPLSFGFELGFRIRL